MEVFDRYALYYDLFYRDKNYADEVDYVDALIKKYAVGETATILDLGCGTGGHAVLLAKKGYDVTGVDRSDTMLAIAEEKKRQEGVSVELQKGDICTVDLHKRFDVAIAMFAVMGYQTTNDALESALLNAARHLNPGGLLIFDGWFGPAVIAQRPQDKILIIEKGSGSVIRLTRPNFDVISQMVDVNFTVLHIENDAIVNRVDEMHKMRFFFPKELEFMLKKAGFEVVGMHAFMEVEGALTVNDWNMAVIARKRSW
jgi:SAM-dependent methyltransferase